MKLAALEFVDTPEVFGADSLILDQNDLRTQGIVQISLTEDGRVSFRGPRAVVNQLLLACAQRGLVLEIETINWCG